MKTAKQLIEEIIEGKPVSKIDAGKKIKALLKTMKAPDLPKTSMGFVKASAAKSMVTDWLIPKLAKDSMVKDYFKSNKEHMPSEVASPIDDWVRKNGVTLNELVSQLALPALRKL